MKKKRGSSRYYILFIFLVVLLVSSTFGIKHLVRNLNFLQIKSIMVIGNKNLETEFLTNIMKDFIGENLFEVSKDDILIKYQNINRIADISISRKVPDKLVLNITEKIGYLYLKTTEGELFPITKNREILDNTQIFESEILPVVQTDFSSNDIHLGMKIDDEWLDEVYSLTEILDLFNVTEDISEIYYENEQNELILVQSSIGCRIIPGKEDLHQKIKRYKFLRDSGSFSKDSYIDLRFENKLIMNVRT